MLSYTRKHIQNSKRNEFFDKDNDEYSARTPSKSSNSTAYISPTSSKKKETSPNLGFIGWILFVAIIFLFFDAIVEMLTTGFGKGIFLLTIDFIVFLLFGLYTNR